MEFKELIGKANQVHKQNFGNKAWFGKCIFLSWYCSIGDCTFCYRSTMPKEINPKKARRSLPSILVEALLTKHLNWELEFLTGGYGIFPFSELVEICRLVSQIIEDKVWLNMGVLNEKQLEELRPYVKGIVASIETINHEVHKRVCPSKPAEPYSKMLKSLKGFKKSIAIIIGLGETIEDFEILKSFIEEHKLDKITFYALKPVRGTEFEKVGSPDPEYYSEWVAKTRIAFPKLEIMTGITPRTPESVKILLEAGANAITKFSATKLFNSEKAKTFIRMAKEAGREFESHLVDMPEIDWDSEVEKLDVNDSIKKETKALLGQYLEKMNKN